MLMMKERKGASQNIAFAAILVAVIAVFSLLATWVPISAIFIILFIPPLSALAVEYCERKYAWLFLFSALSVSIAVTANNYIDTLFYVFPGIISGFFYGYLRKTSFPLTLNVFSSSLLSMGLNYLSLPLIRAIFQVDMIPFTLALLHLQEVEHILYIVPAFVFSLSLAEITISHLLIEVLNAHLNYPKRSEMRTAMSYPFISLLFGALSVGMAFVSPPLGFVFLVFSFYFALAGDFHYFQKGKAIHFIVLVCLVIFSIFLFAFFYKSFPKDTGLLLLSLFLIANDFAMAPIGLQYLVEERKNGRTIKKQ